jgi:hypothetical protein
MHTDLSISHCKHCGLNDIFVYTNTDAYGDIYQFDLCIQCDNDVMRRMTLPERIASLKREIGGVSC